MFFFIKFKRKGSVNEKKRQESKQGGSVREPGL